MERPMFNREQIWLGNNVDDDDDVSLLARKSCKCILQLKAVGDKRFYVYQLKQHITSDAAKKSHI